MNSLSRLPARVSRSNICNHCRRTNALRAISSLHHSSRTTPRPQQHFTSPALPQLQTRRAYASHTPADSIIATLEDQYGTARDEFEIATEETEKKSVYAAADREAAREELDKLKEMYGQALRGADGEEVKRRVGHRLRELENAVEALERAAQEG